MPLIKSGSRDAMSKNISEMVKAGHPQKQAVAAAYRNARKYGGKFADGGSVEDQISSEFARDAAAERMRRSVQRYRPIVAADPVERQERKTIWRAVKNSQFAEGGWLQARPKGALLVTPAPLRSESTERERARRQILRTPPVTVMEDWIAGFSPSKANSNALRDAIRERALDQIKAAGPGPQISNYGYAQGGVPESSWFERSAARDVARSGMLKSAVPGRTDKLPIGVASGSYVVPADIVSALGQGNSDAGAAVLGNLFQKGPYGTRAGGMGGGRPRMGGMRGMKGVRMPRMRADGGDVAAPAEPVPIIAAGGEYVLHPDDVANVGGGDVDRGHSILDAFVKHVRNQHIKTLRGLPGPKRS